MNVSMFVLVYLLAGILCHGVMEYWGMTNDKIQMSNECQSSNDQGCPLGKRDAVCCQPATIN